jgi:ferredoxin--NADP+ reductase
VIGTEGNPLRVAVVGSGPAGFYAAEHLLKHEGTTVEVDMFDRLPTPYGLVRAGVAPDHPKIKSVIRVYEKTAGRPEFRFFGNVEVGPDITVAELQERYHAVVFAYGTSVDRHLGIEGEDLPGSHSATEFVNWYNAHPDFTDRKFDLNCERVVVIGNGNVATDVARMLTLTRGELEVTDTADHAIDPLADCAVKEVLILGRRGPAQAAFTNPEVRELGEIVDADVIVDPAEVELDELSHEWLDSEDASPTNRRNVEIFTEFAGREPEGKRKRVVLRFLSSPVEIQGNGKVERVVVAKNELYRDDSGAIRPRDTGERETIECGMVLRSIGYKGVPVEGVPFDERKGVIPNDGGRVKDPEAGDQLPGLYATGWIKRGPSGVIGTNKKDGQETVDNLFADLEAGVVPDAPLRPPASEVLPGRGDGRGREERRPRLGNRRSRSRFGAQLVRAVGHHRVGAEGQHPLQDLGIVDRAGVHRQVRRTQRAHQALGEQEVLDRDPGDPASGGPGGERFGLVVRPDDQPRAEPAGGGKRAGVRVEADQLHPVYRARRPHLGADRLGGATGQIRIRVSLHLELQREIRGGELEQLAEEQRALRGRPSVAVEQPARGDLRRGPLMGPTLEGRAEGQQRIVEERQLPVRGQHEVGLEPGEWPRDRPRQRRRGGIRPVGASQPMGDEVRLHRQPDQSSTPTRPCYRWVNVPERTFPEAPPLAV